MKKSIISLCTLSLLCFLAACGGGSKNAQTTAPTEVASTMQTTDQLVAKIAAAEEDLYNNNNADKTKFNFDLGKAETLVSAYEAFVAANPSDEKVPTYLFKSAEIYRSLRNFNKSNNCYTQIVTKFPDYEKAPHSLFLMGFSYENDMNLPNKAKEIYEQFLEKYPTHELKDDVQFSLQNLGKSPEDIIKEFEKKRANNPA